MLNRQLAFDRAVNGILNQGGFAMSSAGACKYHGPNNRKCAIGHLLDDDEYEIEIEGKGAFGIPYRMFLPEFAPTALGDHDFLSRMQSKIHDGPSTSNFGKEYFLLTVEHFATEEGLAVNLDQQETTNVE